MDLEKLEKYEKMKSLLLSNLGNYDDEHQLTYIPLMKAEVDNFMFVASTVLPEHGTFFLIIRANLSSLVVGDVYNAIEYIDKLLKIEKASETKIEEMKIFEGANDKLKQASLSFRKEDYTSAFHNLNTALEFVLKDKVKIPITITGVNTSNIIDILVKHKVEPYLYLVEARKHVLLIDNKIKHTGYSPSKIDCINGIKAMEELISRLRGKEIKLTEEIRNKIYQGL